MEQFWAVVSFFKKNIDNVILNELKESPTIEGMIHILQKSDKKMNRNVHAHLKIDTGMGRLGCASGQAGALVEAIKQLPNLSLKGIYTHYASAEDKVTFSKRQRMTFAKILKSINHEFEFTHAKNITFLAVRRLDKFKYLNFNKNLKTEYSKQISKNTKPEQQQQQQQQQQHIYICV